MAKNFYLTTTLPYVNAQPHLGFALELVQADVLVRARYLAGGSVFFNTGTDEHGLKIWRGAQAAGLDPQTFVDQAAAKFKQLITALNLWPEINFIRTTDPAHSAAAQEFWRRAAAAGDIYKKAYKIKYCVGCELEKTESELSAGRCPLHPNLELELIDEENYFFRFSKYQKSLLALYDERPDFVAPPARLREIRAFVERGLADFSISRLAGKMPWGVPVPDDPEQVMYVWFDALVNYISAIGWPDDLEKFEKYWPVVQLAGKDNLRPQAAMWQAMLMSAGLPPSRQIMIHGFLQSAGQKMSKSLGNVIDPFELVAEYGADAVRYYLLRHAHPFEDSDITLEKFKESYNANLANGLGNLVSRVLKMSSTNNVRIDTNATNKPPNDMNLINEYLEKFEFNKAADLIWHKISEADSLIQQTEPFKLIKTDRAKASKIITDLLQQLMAISQLLTPFLPATSAAIQNLIQKNQMPAESLFARK